MAAQEQHKNTITEQQDPEVQDVPEHDISEEDMTFVSRLYNYIIALEANEREEEQHSQEFEQRWNIPMQLVSIKKPANTVSFYRNYKGFFSIPMLALVDAEYKFIWIGLVGKGHMSRSLIFTYSELFECLEDGSIGLPPLCPLPEETEPDIPYFILCDDAFALKRYMTKLYIRAWITDEQRIGNYRISRCRRVVENAFGILANTFRCLLGTLEQKVENVTNLVETAVVLHNLVMAVNEVDHEVEEHNFVPGAWRHGPH
ncbi:uncharacterized protein LOC127840619 [Dreissena polymorpha]|uniref:uncharacterized protein LOC127840619 n=1 Tax=Dreissena polymorpha TaxID=45954 RepID=UPI002263D81E|nr:uncharacterized protein LOC127840619 [Dreissena polymorpha]